MAQFNVPLSRKWDLEHLWHPFTPMQAWREEGAPIIASAEGFQLIDVEGRRYLDGNASLWCNVHGHRVSEIDAAIRDQLGRVAHSTLLGLASETSARLAKRLVDLTPPGLNRVFFSDSGATSVEVALKIAYQYHRQKERPEERDLFVTLSGAYHGDTIGSVSLGGIDVFHAVYGKLLFPTLQLPSPVALRAPEGFTRETYLAHCHAEVESVLSANADRIAAVVVEPLVQGAAGILVHPTGYLSHVREVTRRLGLLLVCDEVAVGFGKTGTLFACEQESVEPDILCLAKGLTGGYLPLAATLTTGAIFEAFLGAPHTGRTFFHGHTFTGNALGCAAALASCDLFETNNVLQRSRENAAIIARKLSDLADHPHVAEVRQKGIMAGIELVADRSGMKPFPAERRLGHQVTLAARERGVIIRPLGDVVVLMPAPAMPGELVEQLCDATLESIVTVTSRRV
jgi:adenosylmethionine-8-amino-7-oxononanoate aminotransferase